jgi:hypothetical protein
MHPCRSYTTPLNGHFDEKRPTRSSDSPAMNSTSQERFGDYTAKWPGIGKPYAVTQDLYWSAAIFREANLNEAARAADAARGRKRAGVY